MGDARVLTETEIGDLNNCGMSGIPWGSLRVSHSRLNQRRLQLECNGLWAERG
jgi:hypothetical protein